MAATNVRPQHNPARDLWEGARDGRSPRDVRRTWARLLPRAAFTNPAARLLAEWAASILHEDSWEAFATAHPDGIDLDPTCGPDR